MRWLTEYSQAFLDDGYLLPGQTVEDSVWIKCEAAEKILNKPGFAKRFYENFKLGWYSFSTPVWANFGNDRGLPISCFGSTLYDKMDSILSVVAEVGMESKHGGGTSGYFGHIRGRGEPITNNGFSSGSVHFMQLFDKTTSIVSQGGTRKGSFAAYLPVDHKDIFEFLSIKSDGHPIQEMHFGVCIPAGWMQSMIDGDNYKRKVWAKIIESRLHTAEPYIVFLDNVNNNTIDVYKDKKLPITHSNLCVAPETQILTSAGYFTVSELENEEIEVWNGKKWSKTTVIKTGSNQKLLTVKFSNGQTLDCTPYHKFYVQRGYKYGCGKNKLLIEEKRTSELQAGDKLIKVQTPIIEFEEDFEDAYTQGFFTGDGCKHNGFNHIDLYGEKLLLVSYLKGHLVGTFREEQNKQRFKVNDKYEKFIVPHRYSIQSRLDWFAGLCDSDGTLLDNQGAQSIQISSVELSFIREVQLMLQTLGINSKVLDGFEEGYRTLPDGRGGNKDYLCQKSYRICIGADGLYNLIQLGFNPKRLKIKNNRPNRNCEHFVKIISVENNNRFDDTYCVNESEEHKVVFNTVITGNCSEILLPDNESESFVCDLGSMNLFYYDEWKDTDAVQLKIQFLDAVMSEFIQKAEGIPFMERPLNFAKRHRALGLGVFGWHSYLQSKMIPFESMEAKYKNIEIFKNIQTKSYEASRQLAADYGEPEVLKGYGRRNTTTMAIAPTTSSAFIIGQASTTIEPWMDNYFTQNLAKGKFSIKNPQLEKVLEEKGKNTRSIWLSILKNHGSVQHLDFLTDHEKEVFKTLPEISQKEIIIQAAARQPYIDQGQSTNLFIYPATPAKQISQLFIEAWQMGIKTLYYQYGQNAAKQFTDNLLVCKNCEG